MQGTLVSLLDQENYLRKAERQRQKKKQQREIRAQGTHISESTPTQLSAFLLHDNFT